MEEPSAYFPDRASWRKWLEKNHRKETVLWLIYYKKHTGKPSVPYNEAVEEALCFGWIDSLVRRLDDERYMQKFTPRKPKSTWSESNVLRVEKMAREGKMRDKGMELYKYAREKGLLPDSEAENKALKAENFRKLFPEVPEYIMHALERSTAAEKTFNSLAPSHKLRYLAWITAAKKEETRLKRLAESISLLESGHKLGMK